MKFLIHIYNKSPQKNHRFEANRCTNMKINLYLEPQFYLRQEGCTTWIYANQFSIK